MKSVRSIFSGMNTVIHPSKKRGGTANVCDRAQPETQGSPSPDIPGASPAPPLQGCWEKGVRRSMSRFSVHRKGPWGYEEITVCSVQPCAGMTASHRPTFRGLDLGLYRVLVMWQEQRPPRNCLCGKIKQKRTRVLTGEGQWACHGAQGNGPCRRGR